MDENEGLKMELPTDLDRAEFLHVIRGSVVWMTGEVMTLDALINEIAKNIYDHVGGRGYLEIIPDGDSFRFLIKDHGEKAYDFESCQNVRVSKRNDVNFGIGLGMIKEIAESLGIELHIDTSRGFSYFGVYTPNRK
jgi:hypothetical protein